MRVCLQNRKIVGFIYRDNFEGESLIQVVNRYKCVCICDDMKISGHMAGIREKESSTTARYNLISKAWDWANQIGNQ